MFPRPLKGVLVSTGSIGVLLFFSDFVIRRATRNRDTVPIVFEESSFEMTWLYAVRVVKRHK